MIRRVAIIGNSCAIEVAGGRPRRDDRTWGEWLEEDLIAAGHPAHVFNQARWFELINEGRARYLDDIRPLFPDVLVVQYGSNECQPNALPTRLARHSAAMHQSTRRVAMSYRQRLLVPYGWPMIRRWQQWAAPRWPDRLTRLTMRRWKEELRRLVTLARADGMLVLVLDVSEFGPRYEHWIPSVSEHRERFQTALEQTIETLHDPGVERIDPSVVLGDLGQDKSIPDGLHWSAEAHRRVAALIAERIEAWDG
jgi:lysophospholipase L1-like esterase